MRRLVGSERQLRRELRRAATNASLHATVGSASLARLAKRPSGGGPPPLERQSTLGLKLAAASSLEPKRVRLKTRVEAAAAAALAQHLRGGSKPPIRTMRMYVDRSAPRGVRDSLLVVSLLPLLTVQTGNLRVEFSGEVGQDAGGLFRAFFESLAAELRVGDEPDEPDRGEPDYAGGRPPLGALGAAAAPSSRGGSAGDPPKLFVEAADKGLLPSPGQAEAEVMALREATSVLRIACSSSPPHGLMAGDGAQRGHDCEPRGARRVPQSGGLR